jgi:hypothetical protein
MFDERHRDGLQRREAARIAHVRVRVIGRQTRPKSAVANYDIELVAEIAAVTRTGGIRAHLNRSCSRTGRTTNVCGERAIATGRPIC